MAASVLKQDRNTEMIKKNAIHYGKILFVFCHEKSR